MVLVDTRTLLIAESTYVHQPTRIVKIIIIYHKISNIRCTKSKNSNASRIGLQLSLCNISKPGGEWRCSWSSADRRCSNYIWWINNLFAYKGPSYIRDLTVHFISRLYMNLLFAISIHVYSDFYLLTHLPIIAAYMHHWNWFSSCLLTSHYLNQWWLPTNHTPKIRHQWKRYQNQAILINKTTLNIIVCNFPILPRGQ